MKSTFQWTGIVLALILSTVALVGGNKSANLSGYTRFPNSDLIAKSLTATNSLSTSTVAAGCVQSTATSSATAIKYIYNTSATTTSINGATVQGMVAWAYGVCP